MGYKDGYRLNSSGTLSVQEGSTVTGFIPAIFGNTIRISGVQFGLLADVGTYCYLALYDTEKEVIASHNLNYPNGLFTTETDDNGIMTFTIAASTSSVASMAYFRISAAGVGANMIVTVNEEIT